MSTHLARQRCFNHTLREAVARCPECKYFYCRECITEHDDRVICAACLRKQLETASLSAKRPPWVFTSLTCAISFVVLWMFFYLCGTLLLQIPAKFHEGTVWVEN